MTDATSTPPEPPRPWGILATLGWAVLAVVASFAATLVAFVVMIGLGVEVTTDLFGDGLTFSVLTIVTNVVQTAVLVLAAYLARWRVVDYLGLTWPSTREVLAATGAVAAFILLFDGATYLLGRDIVTPFQIDTYRGARNSGTLALLWITFVLVAPAGEEVMFRGFLYRGWAVSPRAVWATILVTAGVWASIHVQYDAFGILQIFMTGLLFGLIRWRTGSTLLTFALHALVNAWATVQTTIKVDWLS